MSLADKKFLLLLLIPLFLGCDKPSRSTAVLSGCMTACDKDYPAIVWDKNVDMDCFKRCVDATKL